MIYENVGCMKQSGMHQNLAVVHSMAMVRSATLHTPYEKSYGSNRIFYQEKADEA
jgi:hypothetical protein